MNERIRELRKQVKMDTTKFLDQEFYKNHVEPLANIFTNGDNAVLNEYMTKFAELIVRECTSLFDGTKEMKTVGMLTHNQVVEQIKKHFGVEE